MKQNGFTLIELLAVIVITLMLISIVTISVDTFVKNYKKEISKSQEDIIEEAANLYYLKDGVKNSYNNRSFKLCVNISYLIENDYIEDEEVINLKTNEKLEGSVEITQKSDQYTYKYKEKKCTYEYQAIDEICTAVTNDTKTTGNIPTGKYLLGDEYICEVKNNTKYHFFVISTENDNVNLIMDRNVYYDSANDVGKAATETNTGLVAWYAVANDHSNGPVTAMNYLYSATKDWSNVPNIIMNYEDENIDYNTQQKGTTGYGGTKTINNITTITSKSGVEVGRIQNLKTRMPRYDEVHGTGKCLTFEENGKQYGSCPLWLSNYLNASSYLTGEGLQTISGIYGYWTLSSYAGYSHYACSIDYHGYVYLDDVIRDSISGVRPVISIPKLDIAN